jgi:hypothetical protein
VSLGREEMKGGRSLRAGRCGLGELLKPKSRGWARARRERENRRGSKLEGAPWRQAADARDMGDE